MNFITKSIIATYLVTLMLAIMPQIMFRMSAE